MYVLACALSSGSVHQPIAARAPTPRLPPANPPRACAASAHLRADSRNAPAPAKPAPSAQVWQTRSRDPQRPSAPVPACFESLSLSHHYHTAFCSSYSYGRRDSIGNAGHSHQPLVETGARAHQSREGGARQRRLPLGDRPPTAGALAPVAHRRTLAGSDNERAHVAARQRLAPTSAYRRAYVVRIRPARNPLTPCNQRDCRGKHTGAAARPPPLPPTTLASVSR